MPELAPPAARRVRARRLRVRRIAPLTVFRVSAVFYLTMLVMVLVAGILLWVGAQSIGAIDSVDSFFSDLGFEGFTLHSGRVLLGAALVGLALAVIGTAMNVLMAVLYNVISELVGGIDVVLADEDRV